MLFETILFVAFASSQPKKAMSNKPATPTVAPATHAQDLSQGCKPGDFDNPHGFIDKMPPRTQIQEELRKLGKSFTGASVAIAIKYDATGHIFDSSLNQKTGFESLDAALLRWSKEVTIVPGRCGQGNIPMILDSNG